MSEADVQWDWSALDKTDKRIPKNPEQLMTPRQLLLEGAISAVTQQRNNEYGPPTQDFARTAALATELGFRFEDGSGNYALEPHHVAMFMILLKLSRITWSSEKVDNWLDIAGYAACGHECVVEGS